MSIEEEIRQPKFSNAREKAAVNILFTASWLRGKNASRLKKHNITPEQYNVLRILRGSHPKKMMLSDISSRMIDRNSNATRLVEKLRGKGLVKRNICEENRRQVDISITAKGMQVLSSIDSGNTEWRAILKNMSKKEAGELNRILDKLRSK